MDENLMIRTRRQLESEFYLMNEDWLRDCIEYYVTERHNERPSNKEILEFVKAQWQLSDLREIHNGTGSLPRNLAAHKFIVLPGTYILQVDQMYDISVSKYKQLQRIRNSSTINIEVTEAEETREENWVSKSQTQKRMIQLKLTDGVQDVLGIEYTQIACLNEMLLPGYKVLIKGPVKCRKGVLLLQEGNIQGVGGEVEHLLIPNALENILARALKLPENSDPYNDNATKKNKQNTNDDKKAEELLLEGDFDINIDEVFQIEASHQQSSQETNEKTVKSDSQNKASNAIATSAKSGNSSNIIRNNKPIKTENNSVVTKEEILIQDEEFLEMIEEEHFTSHSATIKVEPVKEKSIRTGPFRTGPKERVDFDDDDIIEIMDELDHVENKYEHHKKETSTNVGGKSSAFIPAHSSSASTSKSLKQQTIISSPIAGTKRPAVSVSPLSTAQPKKGKLERKIIDFCKPSTPPEEPRKICDYLRDVLKQEITDTTIRTVRGHLTYMGKLSKKDLSWILDATISDNTGFMDVSFSNAVLENILGFDVKEFSRKRKMKKNPQIDQELRTSLRTAEQKLKTLDALMELELAKGKKATVIKITELTEQEKQAIEKRLKYLNERQ